MECPTVSCKSSNVSSSSERYHCLFSAKASICPLLFIGVTIITIHFLLNPSPVLRAPINLFSGGFRVDVLD